MTIISLGAGVQSSTMFLMSCLGELEKVDAAIFADTMGEPPDVYEHVEYLSEIGERFGIPVYTVSGGDLLKDYLEAVNGDRNRASSIPFYTKAQDGSTSILPRQCTLDYKIKPVKRKVRELMKNRGDKEVEMWMGISTDEILRMKDSPVKYITHRWPLIEKGMDRRDCVSWYKSNEFKRPPRSACYYCPFHSNEEWRRIRDEYPDLFQKAIEIDKKIRSVPKVNSEVYMHKDRIPFDKVDLNEENQIDLFENECTGMCGV